MAFFSRHIRLLFALALFQVIGGPLVLCGVVFFSQTAIEEPALSLSERIGHTIDQVQRLENQAQGLVATLSDADASLPAKPNSAPPVKVKEGKAKLQAIPQTFGMNFYAQTLQSLGDRPWHDPAPVSRAYAPLIPPPRLGLV